MLFRCQMLWSRQTPYQYLECCHLCYLDLLVLCDESLEVDDDLGAAILGFAAIRPRVSCVVFKNTVSCVEVLDGLLTIS